MLAHTHNMCHLLLQSVLSCRMTQRSTCTVCTWQASAQR